MTSSMLGGEKRWSSARRGGMTVLGKVAVPKPINLPSQRLENHGLDPNVEIVPKGTLSWGNKSSSSGTSAWGSSSVSPNTDSGSGSPSHLCGRPSSGGGGTRPSTAGSERSHEPSGNAWGPSSRPSSASGAVTLSQTSSTSLRPHSAETKPSSSHLSRFAEISENSVAWNSALTTEKVGMVPCKSDGFSLTSGDFPTLGSEKECVGTDAKSQDDGSGGVAPRKERTGTSVTDDPQNANVNVGSVNSWRSDNLPHNEDGSRPNVEKWMGHPQPYPANIPPPHYDAWHGSPVSNSQGGVWYRGPPQGGHPYRTPVPPGSFPMEPFLYYPSQVPPGGLPNPQPVPRGTGPRGHNPKTGDIYRPMPDAFIHPGVSIRPGFYPGPVTYEGYYRPSMSYCNSNDRDSSFMGMPAGPAGPAGPAVYNRYLGQSSSEPVSSHAMSSGFGSGGRALAPEQVESGPLHDDQGPYKVLLKQPGNLNVKNEEENIVNSTSTNQPMFDKADQPKMSTWENDWGLEHKKEADLRRRAFGVEAFSQSSDNQEPHSENVKAKSRGIVGNSDRLVTKLEDDADSSREVSQSLATATKDSSLIQKIEGLNAKVRASDVRYDAGPIFSREEQSKFQHSTQSDHFAYEASESVVYPEKTDLSEVRDPISSELSMTSRDRNIKLSSGATIPRRPNRGTQDRSDHHSRGKVNSQEVDGRHKRPLMDSPGIMANANQESSIVSTMDHNALGAIDKAESFSPDSHGDVPATSTLDSKQSQAQRTKMRELAKQRTQQLQEEEEERTRKQRARALAKLQELNKRTIVGEGPTQWAENASNDAMKNKKEEHPNFGDPRIPGIIFGDQTTAIVSDSHVVAHNSESITGANNTSLILSGEMLSKKPGNGHKEHVLAHNQLKPLEQELNVSVVAQSKNASEVLGGTSLKHKRTGTKQKQNIPSEKNFSEKPSSHVSKESKSQTVAGDIHVPVEESSNIGLNPVAESSLGTRKKNNKNGKNKHKVEEAFATTLSPPVSNEANLITEFDKLKASESVTDPSSDPPVTINKDASQFRDQPPLLPVAETLGKGNGQWKSQHSRRMLRNSQNRSEKSHGSDSVIWAPVRALNKNETTDEAVQKNEAEAVVSSLKIDNQVQNIPKNKRAEREIYVPKPVAKEMAQQGTIHQDVLSINQTSDDTKPDSSSQSSDNTRSAGAVSENVSFSSEHGNGDGRHHKHTKSHASWRQRGATESTNGQCSHDQSYVSNDESNNFQKSSECYLPEKASGSSKNELAAVVNEWDPPEGWNDPNYSASIAPVTTAVAKDQVVTGRGKRPQFKGHKGAGNNYDLHENKLKNGGHKKISPQASAPEADQRDASIAAKENQAVGERSSSHWQPKAARMAHTQNQRSFKPNDDQNVNAEVSQTNEWESRKPLSLHSTKTSEDLVPSQYDSSICGKPIIEEGLKKSSSLKDRPYSPNQGPANSFEAVPGSTDVRREPSFYQRSGDHNNRFGKWSESRRDWNSSQHHKQQHYQPTNRDRQRQNLHFEYQPVGPHNGKSNMDRPKDTTQPSGPKYMERGQGHSRRDGANFYKQ